MKYFEIEVQVEGELNLVTKRFAADNDSHLVAMQQVTSALIDIGRSTHKNYQVIGTVVKHE